MSEFDVAKKLSEPVEVRVVSSSRLDTAELMTFVRRRNCAGSGQRHSKPSRTPRGAASSRVDNGASRSALMRHLKAAASEGDRRAWEHLLHQRNTMDAPAQGGNAQVQAEEHHMSTPYCFDSEGNRCAYPRITAKRDYARVYNLLRLT